MAKFKELGEVRQIEIEGTWVVRPDLGNLDENRRVVSQYLCGENSLWFYHAEDKVPLSAASGASIWQLFSAARGANEQTRQLMPSDFKKLTEMLKVKGDSSKFTLYSARLRVLAGRMMLHVQGTEVETQVEHDCVLLPKRTVSGWMVQELGFRFDRSWHKKMPLVGRRSYSKLISSAWNSIEWNQTMPPLYVPSKVAAAPVSLPAVPAPPLSIRAPSVSIPAPFASSPAQSTSLPALPVVSHPSPSFVK